MNVIAELLKVPGKVVSLEGDWGSGKTYSWYNTDKPEETISSQLEKDNRKPIYVSLFGKQSVSQLKKEILNKTIATKGCVFHFFMIAILLFFLTALMAIFAFQIISNPEVRSWVLLISVLVAGFTVGNFYEHILKFFAQKTIGFDHDNIDFGMILNSDKVIFCFDDLERLSGNANLEEFMGFFELLSRQKFSMLLIYNSNYQVDKHKEKWKEFKEKVVTVSLQHKKNNIIETIIDNRGLTDFEKYFIKSIYDSLQEAGSNLELYIETERQYITKLASNFRFYNKLIEAYGQVKSVTCNYEGLNENTIGNMLMYITVIKVHDDLELPLKEAPTKDYLYNFLYGRELLPEGRNELKHFGSIFQFNQWYGLVEFSTIYEFLKYGYFDYNVFKQEHTSVSNSELEKYTMNLGHWLNYRTPEQEKIVENIESLLQAEPISFTSLENMRQVLTKYSVFCSYINKDLSIEISDILTQKITDFIDNNEVPIEILADPAPWGIFIHTTGGENEIFLKNKKFINKIFETSLLNFWIAKIKAIPNMEMAIKSVLIGDFSYYNQLFLYVLFNDVEKQQQIFRLRDTNYSKWQDIISYLNVRIGEYKEDYGFIKRVRKLLNDTRNSKELFIEALAENVREVEMLPGAGLSEHYTVENFFNS